MPFLKHNDKQQAHWYLFHLMGLYSTQWLICAGHELLLPVAQRISFIAHRNEDSGPT